MTITLRLDKGSELTFQELDNNFTDLNSRLNVLETTDTDNQTLTLNGTTLSISNGNSVDLGSVSASVSIGDSAPTGPAAGDLWWQSDVGRLRIYYTDTGGSQWVDASPTGAGGSGSNVTVSDGAPSTPVQGDLWWESDVGKLRIYYNNVWVDAAPSGTGGSTSGDLSISSISALGDVDFNGITLDGSNGQNKVLAWDEALQRFVPRGTAVVTVSDVQPATPVEGDLWWESDVGKLRIYYNDGVQSQWVDANPAGTGVDQDDLNVVTSRGSTTTNAITVGGVTSTDDIGITGSLTASGTISSDTSLRTQGNIEFEGSTNNAFETRLQVIDPTQDNTITFQNASGTVAFTSDITAGNYGNNEVDAHLNTSTATPGQILTWNGADYTWLVNQPSLALQDLSNVDHTTTPMDGQILHWVVANGQFEFTTLSSGATVSVGDDAPAGTPTQGDLWWESDTGVLKVYYSGAWIDAVPQSTSGSSSSLINGDGHLVVENDDPELHLISTDAAESYFKLRKNFVTDAWDIQIDGSNSVLGSFFSLTIDNVAFQEQSVVSSLASTTFKDTVTISPNDLTNGDGSLQINSGFLGEAKIVLNSNDPKIGIGTTTPAVSLDIATTDAIQVPDGTTAQRPGSPAAGMFRYNTDTSGFEGYNGTAWGAISPGSGETLTLNGYAPSTDLDFDENGSIASSDSQAYAQFAAGTARTDAAALGSQALTAPWSPLTGSTYTNNKFGMYMIKGNSNDALRDTVGLSPLGHGDTVIFGNVNDTGSEVQLTNGYGVSGNVLHMNTTLEGAGVNVHVDSGDLNGRLQLLCGSTIFAPNTQSKIEMHPDELTVEAPTLILEAPAIDSTPQAVTHTVIDNTASAYSYASSGKADILKIDSTNSAEGVSMSGTLDVTGTSTFTGVTQHNLGLNVSGGDQLFENHGIITKTVTITNPTGVVAYDLAQTYVFWNDQPVSDWTVNLLNFGPAGNTIDTWRTITLPIIQDSTPYIPIAFQINSLPLTILWEGGTPPTGTSNGVDVVTFRVGLPGGSFRVIGKLESYS